MQPANKKSKRTTSDPITITDEDIKDMLDMSEQETYNPTPIDTAGAKPYDPEDEDEFYDPEIATFDEKPPPPTKKSVSRGDPAFSSDNSSPSPPPPKSKFGTFGQNLDFFF